MEKKSFLDLKVPVFYNKKNGQISISLPKKKLKKLLASNTSPPKSLPIRLFWSKKKKETK